MPGRIGERAPCVKTRGRELGLQTAMRRETLPPSAMDLDFGKAQLWEKPKDTAPQADLEGLALASLIALLRLVDDIDAALAADDLVVAMTTAQGLE